MATANTMDVSPVGGLMGVIRAVSRPSLWAGAVGILAVASSVVTYATVTGLVPYNPTPAQSEGRETARITPIRPPTGETSIVFAVAITVRRCGKRG